LLAVSKDRRVLEGGRRPGRLGQGVVVALAEAAGAPDAGSPGRRASRARNATATIAQAATATQSMNRLRGSMNLRWATLPNDSVATLYMPRGKTTLHSVGS